jgi:hypothetical protein
MALERLKAYTRKGALKHISGNLLHGRVRISVNGAICPVLVAFNFCNPAAPFACIPDNGLGLNEGVLSQAFATRAWNDSHLRQTKIAKAQEFISLRVVDRHQQSVIECVVEPIANAAKSCCAEVNDPAAPVQLFCGERELETQGIAVEEGAVAFCRPLPQRAGEPSLGTICLCG